ncbi:hypothetical protein [Nocardia jejuensis]|uniref:hypothetical protein n=1 Tax=Nocardia jejuensis TaxID=328049 RepID=UPI000AA6D392|nr:hypothetical protein [Nocardia jejuensis]
MPKPKDPAIYIGDTVHTISREGVEGKARWTVEEIDPARNTVRISRTVKTGFRRYSDRDIPFTAARIALVRHGNAMDDQGRKNGIPPRQQPRHSDRTQSPYVLEGIARRAETT